MTDQNLPAPIEREHQDQPITAFSSLANFEAAQRMAKALSTSDLVPAMYRGDKGLANCLIAMEVAARTGSSILAVTQNLNVIQGKPSWSSSYIIAALNTCGRFTPLNFRLEGSGDGLTCTAVTTDKATGDEFAGPPVSIKTAKDEGWYGRSGSKWKTMPELMLRYRAAAFFGRLYAPDILMGMQSDEEASDIAPPKIVNPDAAPITDDDGRESKSTTRRKRRTKAQIEADKQAEQQDAGHEAGTEAQDGQEAEVMDDGQGRPPPISHPDVAPIEVDVETVPQTAPKSGDLF